METFLELLSQFTGTGGGTKHALVNFGVAAIFWALLWAMARVAPRNSDPLSDILILGFAIALSRELFMVAIRALEAYQAFSAESLHLVFPPLEHALSNIGLALIAAGFVGHLTGNDRWWRRFAYASVALLGVIYLTTASWWAWFSANNPEIRFGQTWTDWAFRIAASVILGIAAVGAMRAPKSRIRIYVVVGLVLLFANEFLKIIDMALGERHEADFAVVRHSAYLAALPILAFAYIKDQAARLADLLHTLEDRVSSRTEELEGVNAELRGLSATDGLTQIANRSEFDRRYAEIWMAAARASDEVTVMIVDANDFKTINDTHGHEAGDRVLRSIASLLSHHAGERAGIIARIGGDEFALVFLNLDSGQSELLADAIRDDTIEVRGSDEPLSVSVGHATSKAVGFVQNSNLLRQADAAMYADKRSESPVTFPGGDEDGVGETSTAELARSYAD